MIHGRLGVLAAAMCAGVFAGGSSAAAQSVGGENLLLNPGAEIGASVSDTTAFQAPAGWTVNGSITQARYGSDPRFPSAPEVGGASFFAGGPAFKLGMDPALRTMSQTVDLSAPDVAAAIDRGNVRATLSGALGGYEADPDSTTVVATFRGGHNPLFRLQIGPVSADDRLSITTLSPRVVDGLVPVGMRSVDVVVTFARASSFDYNDASADNLAIVLRDESPPVVHATTIDAVGTSSAQIDASVEDYGTAADAHVEYGDTTSYGQSGPAVATAGTNGVQLLDLALADLTPDHDYHARVVLDGPYGSAVGDDVTFRTVGDAPDTTIDSGPSGETFSSSATFTFSSDAAGATFECSLDEVEFVACVSGDAITGLDDGPHTFDVRAIAGSQHDATPARRSFSVNTAPPDTIIDTAAAALSNDPTATFAFHSDPAGATFECRVDDAMFAACESPATTAPLADGQHTFEVRAVAHGHTDPTPASATFTVDTIAPQTTITAGPADGAHLDPDDPAPIYEFASSEAASTFACDTHAPAGALALTSCTSPAHATPTGTGSWQFEVAATDVAGNTDPTPASRTFTNAAPDTVIDTGPSGEIHEPTATFTFHSEPAGATFQCSLDDAAFAACASGDPITGLPDGSHTFAVRAVVGGVRDHTPATRAFSVNTAPPETTIVTGPPALTNLRQAGFHGDLESRIVSWRKGILRSHGSPEEVPR